MSDYTLYCTEEQTKKALELGAPIEYYLKGIFKVPTAEQMAGWLEEQGITFEIVRCDNDWYARTYSDENTNFNKGRFSSRKEAMLSAIDVAIEYLRRNRND